MNYLELVPDPTTQVFIEGLKKLIARYRSLKTICSENAKTFKTVTLRPRLRDYKPKTDELLEKDSSFIIYHGIIQTLAIEVFEFLSRLSLQIMNEVF